MQVLFRLPSDTASPSCGALGPVGEGRSVPQAFASGLAASGMIWGIPFGGGEGRLGTRDADT